MPEYAPIRIAIVIDDHALFRDALAMCLALQLDFQVVANHAAVAEAPQLVRATAIDMVLLDLNLDHCAEAAYVARAHEARFRGSILVVTADISDQEGLELMRRGCGGIFLKHQPMNKLYQLIRAAAAGVPAQRGFAATAISGPRQMAPSLSRKLTPREAEVLFGIFKGLSNKEVAGELGISENTVKTFVQQLFQKTGARTRSQLVRTAMEHYWEQLENGAAPPGLDIAVPGLPQPGELVRPFERPAEAKRPSRDLFPLRAANL